MKSKFNRSAGILILCLTSFFFQPSLRAAFVDQDMVTVQSLLEQINDRKHAWLGLQTRVKMIFTTAQNKTASCDGVLTYLRLEEKIFLECRNAQGQPLFIFKTEDVRFEMYLPQQKKLFKGNIFDLEDNDEFNSHIKPFDLYRALKPLPLLADEITLDNFSGDLATLMVWANDENTDYVKRKVIASSSGQVLQEQFLNPDGAVEKEIMRASYKEVAANDGSRDTFFMPHDIRLTDHIENQETRLVFHQIKLIQTPPMLRWDLEIPSDTEIFIFPEIQTAPKRQTYFN